MNREIKFRAWHRERKVMFSPEEMGQDQLTLMPDGRGFANISSGSTMLSQIDNNKKMIPLQYTGLHDKNGIEIYEGDIVDIRSIPDEVYWEEMGCQFRLASRGNRQFDKTRLITIAIKGEVIGNIYENHELLEALK